MVAKLSVRGPHDTISGFRTRRHRSISMQVRSESVSLRPPILRKTVLGISEQAPETASSVSLRHDQSSRNSRLGPHSDEAHGIIRDVIGEMPNRPLISVVMPVYNTEPEYP